MVRGGGGGFGRSPKGQMKSVSKARLCPPPQGSNYKAIDNLMFFCYNAFIKYLVGEILKDKIIIGKIFGVHGIRGDIKVYPLTDDINRYKELKEVYIENTEYSISSVRMHKKNILMKLNNIDTRNDAEKLKDKYIEIDRDDAVKLNDGEFFIEDLKGLRAVDKDKNQMGIMKDVIDTAAIDIYVFDIDGQEMMLTAMKENILEINLKEGYIKIDLKNGVS